MNEPLQLSSLPLGALLLSSPIHAPLQVPQGSAIPGVEVTVVLAQGQAVPGAGGATLDHIYSLTSNGVGGFAARVQVDSASGSEPLIFGAPEGATPGTVLVSPPGSSALPFSWTTQTGIADDGAVLHTVVEFPPPAPLQRTVFRDATALATTGGLIPGMIDRVWGKLSGVALFGDGRACWKGGIVNVWTQGVESETFFLDGVPVLQQQQVLPNVPSPLAKNPIHDNLLRFSPNAVHYLAVVAQAWGYPAVVMDGEGLVLDGELVSRGEPVPASIGGLPGERWRGFYSAPFNGLGITDDGEYVFRADIDSTLDGERYDVLVKDGEIVLREGDVLEGGLILGRLFAVDLSANGGLATVWTASSADGFGGSALLYNGREVLRTGSGVDLDGDGAPEPGASITQLNANDFFSESFAYEAAATTAGVVYLPAQVDTLGSATPLDDIEVLLAVRPHDLLAPTSVSHSAAEGVSLTLLEPCSASAAFYLLIGSLSGSGPGLPLGAVNLPLLPDAYTNFTLANPGSAALQNNVGEFDALGAASARFVPGVGPVALIGSTATHAFVTIALSPFPEVTFASNAADTLILP